MIPSAAGRTTPDKLDPGCSLIERLFRRLENRRRVATRYDRPAAQVTSGLAPVAVVAEWVR